MLIGYVRVIPYLRSAATNRGSRFKIPHFPIVGLNTSIRAPIALYQYTKPNMTIFIHSHSSGISIRDIRN